MKLTSSEDAIKQAIEGGLKPNLTYRGNLSALSHPDQQIVTRPKTEEEILLDPLFWQALGKARGWEGTIIARHKYLVPIVKEVDEPEYLSEVNQGLVPYPAWHWYASLWFEIRLSNGDESAFWQSLP